LFSIVKILLNYYYTEDSVSYSFLGYKTLDCDGILMELFLDVVKNGAKAMDWDVQDPPRSYGDLEGGWCVWKKGGSASPWIKSIIIIVLHYTFFIEKLQEEVYPY